jgi:hypothetical protein
VSPAGPIGAPLPPWLTTGLTDAPDATLAALRRLPEGRAARAGATELEVTFLTQLLAAMRRTVPQSDYLPRSAARSVYEGAFDRAVAEAMAQGDPLGLVGRLGGQGSGLKIPGGRAEE